MYWFPYLMQVVHGRDDLSEDFSCLLFCESAFVADMIIKLSAIGVLHHYDDLFFILKDCNRK